jgi:hypothetical protein
MDQALALVRGTKDPGQALNLLREYLQTLILRSFHECEAFRSLAFVGGTALRFLYNNISKAATGMISCGTGRSVRRLNRTSNCCSRLWTKLIAPPNTMLMCGKAR